MKIGQIEKDREVYPHGGITFEAEDQQEALLLKAFFKTIPDDYRAVRFDSNSEHALIEVLR